MTFFEAYDAILALGATSERATRVAEMRREFERRTGEFVPEDAWFEARSRAFWDDAVTTQGFAREVEAGLPADATRMDHAPRTRASRPLRDGQLEHPSRSAFAISGEGPSSSFTRSTTPCGTRSQQRSRRSTRGSSGATSRRVVAMLPGAVFHPAEAAEPIAAVLKHARGGAERRRRPGRAASDGARVSRERCRVKAAYAYRADRLGPRRAG